MSVGHKKNPTPSKKWGLGFFLSVTNTYKVKKIHNKIYNNNKKPFFKIKMGGLRGVPPKTHRSRCGRITTLWQNV